MVDIAGRLVGVSSAKMAFTPAGCSDHRDLGSPFRPRPCATVVKGFKAVAQKKPSAAATQQLQSTRRGKCRSSFGMQLQDLTAELTDAFDLVPGRGVLVSAVEPRSPAAEIGVERGLVIYRVGTARCELGEIDREPARARAKRDDG